MNTTSTILLFCLFFSFHLLIVFTDDSEIALDNEQYNLDSPYWDDALIKLASIAESKPSKEASIASCMLGDFYAGITPVTGSWTPPPVDLKKAFYYYLNAVRYPFPDIAKAHYMIGFIAHYHPSLVTEDFQPKHKALGGSDHDDPNSAPQGMDMAPLTESDQLAQPNIPLILLHQSFAARGNYTPALISLGYKYFNGYYTPVSCLKSSEFYRLAAHHAVSTTPQNRPQIKLSSDSVVLSNEYNSGKSVLAEEQDVVQLYRYSADTGSVESQLAMGIIYLEGGIGGLVRDYSEAMRYFEMAMEGGDASAISFLAYMYQNGYGVEEADNETAINFYTKAAEMGNANAQTQLGLMSYYGWGVEKDLEKAERWFQKAAEKNDPEALLYLGRMVFAGLGAAKSYSRARTYFQNSAQGGNLVALYNLGIINANGFGIRASCPNAVTIYRKVLERSILKSSTVQAYKNYARGLFDRALVQYEISADQGDVLAQINVAWLYEMGIGMTTLGGSHHISNNSEREDNMRKALEFYVRAAQQGSPEAHLKIGDFYYYGWGIPKPSYEIAAAYYGVASNLRNAQASFNLGYMHHFGIGLPKDYHLAKRFYDLAYELDPNAYYPSALALFLLWSEQLINHLEDGGLLYGYQWDTLAIAILSLILLISILARRFVLG